MMDKTTKKTVAQMDGQLTAAVGEDENIFVECKRVEAADKALDEAKEYRTRTQREKILEAFRTCVFDFVSEYGFAPTTALLGYNDRQDLQYAYGIEYEEKFGTSAPYAKVDGIKICGGCNQTDGMIQLRKSAEGE